jgi:CBS domain containing-hemolysin-like protein
VCGPIAWFLNKLLGQEAETSLTKHDLLTILEDEKTIAHADVDTDERRIMRGSLLYSHRTVADVLTPAPVVFSVQETDVLTQDFLLKLRDMGFSRIPVHTGDKNQYIGILYLKDLVGVACPSTVEAQMDKPVHFVSPTGRLDRVLNEFILTKMHLFIVLDEFGAFEGVITVEDIVE